MKILVTIVLYNCKYENSKTINSILNISNINNTYDFFIWDNGCDDQKENISSIFDYHFNNENVGLSKAYNFSLEICKKNNYKWLLLFDQDSIIPDDFFINLDHDLDLIKDNNQIVSIVPRVFFGTHNFSPSKVLLGGIHRPIDKNHFGIYKNEIFAINSGSLIKVSFLNDINGFNDLFWLDSLDRWLYLKIYNTNHQVFVNKSKIQHELSILDYGNQVSTNRYINILNYEIIFSLYYFNFINLIFFNTRLFIRSLNFLISKTKFIYGVITLKKFFLILFFSKNYLKRKLLKK